MDPLQIHINSSLLKSGGSVLKSYEPLVSSYKIIPLKIVWFPLISYNLTPFKIIWMPLTFILSHPFENRMDPFKLHTSSSLFKSYKARAPPPIDPHPPPEKKDSPPAPAPTHTKRGDPFVEGEGVGGGGGHTNQQTTCRVSWAMGDVLHILLMQPAFAQCCATFSGRSRLRVAHKTEGDSVLVMPACPSPNNSAPRPNRCKFLPS